MNFNGIPLHPLVVHAAVVLTPLAAVLCLAYAVVPRWRWLVRWPAVAITLGGAVAVYVAALSGDNLKDRLQLHSALMEEHESWAGRLQLGMWVLLAAIVIAAYVMPFRTPLTGRSDRAAHVGVLSIPVTLVLVVVAVFVAYAVYRTGDAGAHLVWDGTPT